MTVALEPDRQPSIQAVRLTKEFGSRVCVDSLSFSVYPGELYALLGDNGAGKTTTINMLTTLLTPTSGESYICGFHSQRQAEDSKALFGVVSQDIAIYQELTAYENLAFVAELYGIPQAEADERVEQLLRHAGLLQRANDRAGEFSDGMQRKLSIATAILHDPKVLFMDEPTVGLDPGARRQIWATLKVLKEQGVTILLTTHYLEEAEILADKVGIIRQGQLVIEGTVEELRRQIGKIRSISITLAARLPDADLEEKVSSLRDRLNAGVSYDPVGNTIVIPQPPDTELADCLESAVSWLRRAGLPFASIATRQPSLEEIFLSITQEDATAGAIAAGEAARSGEH